MDNHVPFSAITNPIGALHQLLDAAALSPGQVKLADRYEASALGWVADVTMEIDSVIYSALGSGISKQTAKREAFGHLYDQVLPLLRERISFVRDNYSPLAGERTSKRLMYSLIHEHLKCAKALSEELKTPVVVLELDNRSANYERKSVQIGDQTIHYKVDSNNVPHVLATSVQRLNRVDRNVMFEVYNAQPLTSADERECKILLDADVVPNSNPNETPIEPVMQTGVQDNPGAMTIPHLPNPQQTNITPATAMQDPSLVSALEPITPHEYLNPVGAPNMLGVGGIEFDIKDLIYSQFIDCDTQFQYTDDTPQGQVIFQIPYDPTSQYVNPYIRQWLAIHPRYTGAINYRFTVIGNATFSGLIGFSWYPQAINSNVVKISEMMKYSYTSMGVNQPSNRIFTLFDARQTQFWRDTGDDPKLNPRPVIVCYVYMTAVSPLKEGITIRIRVASKLSDGSMPMMTGPAFVAANPTVASVSPGIGKPSPTGLDVDYRSLLIGLPVLPVILRPLQLTTTTYLAIDGLVFKPKFDVQMAGDFIIDTSEAYNATSNPSATGYVTGCTGIWKDQTATHSYITGAYVFDASKCNYLLRTLTDQASFAPKFAIDFNHSFVGPEPVRGALQYGVEKAIEFLQSIASSYNLVVYQYAEYLNPTNISQQTVWVNNGMDVITKTFMKELKTWCFYTNYGPLFFFRVLNNESYEVQLGPGQSCSTSSRSPFHSPYFQYTQITSITPFPGASPESMPDGWRNACLMADVPFVTAQAVNSYQNYNHESVQSIFTALSFDIPPTQCIQVTLSDTDSGTDLAYIRYYADRQAAIINLGPNAELVFGTLIRPIRRVYVSHFDVVERSNTFPITNAANFASNTITRVQHLNNVKYRGIQNFRLLASEHQIPTGLTYMTRV